MTDGEDEYKPTDGEVYRHVMRTHFGAALGSCPYCREHIFRERNGVIPRPGEAS